MNLVWTDGSGRLNLSITKEDARSASHSGDCEDDIKELLRDSYIKDQVNSWDKHLLAEVLSEYGAWSDEELTDHKQNKVRMLWIACNDVTEEFD